MDWKLAEAETRLGELMTRAAKEGPQTIRSNGDAVVVIAEPTYRALMGERPSFKQLLLDGPSLEGIIADRDRSPTRGVEL